MTTRGVGEVPFGSTRTGKMNITQRRVAVDVRAVTLNLQQTQAPPTPPSNLRVTAQAFQNLVQWTRSFNADYTEVLVGNSPDVTAATVINAGGSSQYVDSVGAAGIQRFYWVRSAKNTGNRSTQVGYSTATTLAAGTPIVPPAPPPAAQVQVLNRQLGRVDILLNEGEVQK